MLSSTALRPSHHGVSSKITDTLPDDFTDVELDSPAPGLSTPVYLLNGTRAAVPLDYSSSSSSTCSQTSSARSSNSGSEDFDDLSDESINRDKRHYNTTGTTTTLPSVHEINKFFFKRSSTITVLSTSTAASTDEDDDLTDSDLDRCARPVSAQTSIATSEYALPSNKLNGYVLHSLKSNSSLSLLNPNVATAQSRSSVHSHKELALFDNSVLNPIRCSSSPTVLSTKTVTSEENNKQSENGLVPSRSATSLHPTTAQKPRLSVNTSTATLENTLPLSSLSVSKRLNRPGSKSVSSVSILGHASQVHTQPHHLVSQNLRTNPPNLPGSISSIILPESADETDAFAPLPSSKKNLQRALSRSGRYRQHNIPPASKTPHSFSTSSISSLASPESIYPNSFSSGLTAQQRLRIHRSKSSNRLTTKQLELQFDSEDVDDDIPTDSLVFNVPLSPALYAKTQQSRSMTLSSLHSHSSSHNSINSNSYSYSIKTNGNNTHKRINSRSSLPSHISQSSISSKSLASIKETTPTLYFSNTGLENLSEDARDLTVAFQNLPTSISFDQGLNRVNEKNGPYKLPPKNHSSPYSNDPAPISKEKEAVLSRTRPSWLPPKSPEEEKRHIFEYQKMMAKVSQFERNAEQRKQQLLNYREKQRAKDEKIWKVQVLPHFEKALEDPRTRKLWWRGIPAKYRALVWKACAGNTLGINKSTFADSLSRAKSLIKACEATRGGQQQQDFKPSETKGEDGFTLEQQTNLYDQFMKLKADIAFTCFDLKVFDTKSEDVHNSMVDVLQAFAIYRSDIGYQQGLCHIAAVLCLVLDNKLDAFTALCNMLNNSLIEALYLQGKSSEVHYKNDGPSKLDSFYKSFLESLDTNMPSLYKHFKNIGLAPQTYLDPILRAMLANRCKINNSSSLNSIFRIWDIMFLEGDDVLCHFVLAALQKFEHKLYTKNAQEVQKVLVGWSKETGGSASGSGISAQSDEIKPGFVIESVDEEDCFVNNVRTSFIK